MQIKIGSMLYGIDTRGQQSGSPVYFQDSGKYYTIGIHKGCSHHDKLNVGVKITLSVIRTL
jgi:tetratricopeptide (TPR) repeat protein